jgi:hypothetical protein
MRVRTSILLVDLHAKWIADTLENLDIVTTSVVSESESVSKLESESEKKILDPDPQHWLPINTFFSLSGQTKEHLLNEVILQHFYR